ncbi:MAG TPA: hypothetical protein VHH09_01640, partial [Acidimicrobiales bacterium]|nr:hypothetical protein [Acidimicrobiales bacterium]
MSRVALAVASLATAAVLLVDPDSRGLVVVLLLVAFAALAVLVGSERRHRRLGRREVGLAAAALLVLAVVVPPRQSGDLWSYAMYGRMVSEYQVSPYRHTPAEFRTDPIGQRVPRFWERSRSVYGPGFTAVSVAGMAVAGRSPLVARLFFQGLAALAVALALVLVDRRSRDPVALAFLAVNPLTVVSVVNGGHGRGQGQGPPEPAAAGGRRGRAADPAVGPGPHRPAVHPAPQVAQGVEHGRPPGQGQRPQAHTGRGGGEDRRRPPAVTRPHPHRHCGQR